MSENIEIRLKKSHLKLAGLIALALAVIIVGTAIAAYLGPNRFGPQTTCTTNCTAGDCSYTGSMTTVTNKKFFSCTLKLSAPDAGSCMSANAAKAWFTESACGWDSPSLDAWGPISSSFNGWSCTTTSTTCTTITVALSPATVSSSTACTANGSNGWCVGSAILNISSNDPLAGYNIVFIEGEMDSASVFGCGGSTCPVPVPEGNHSFEFWSLSDYGDGSLKGNATVKVDTVNPSVGTGISGTLGSNGWYVSNADVSGSASDASSGLASLQVQTNGGGFGTYSAPITLTEGTHSVDFIATDNAGLTASTSVNVNVDTTLPTVTLGNPGTVTATVTLSGNYADATSGVASVEVNPAGTGWVNVSFSGGAWSYAWNSTAVSNGSYTLQARSVDTAGNVSVTASVTVIVNNTLPFVNLPGSWYIWDAVSIVVKEGALPLAGAKITISDPQGRWTARTINYNGAYANGFTWDRKFGDGTTAPIGDYKVKVEAWDTIGQRTTKFGTIMIPAPAVSSSTASTSTTDPAPSAGASGPTNFVILNDIESSSNNSNGSGQSGGGGTVPDDSMEEGNAFVVPTQSPELLEPQQPSPNGTISSSLKNALPYLWGLGAGVAAAGYKTYQDNKKKKLAAVAGQQLIVAREPNFVTKTIQQGWNTIKERVPKMVERVQNVVSYVKKAVPVFVEKIKNIPKMIVEAVPRFVENVKKVVHKITHSEVVTKTKQVLTTVWETITEKVPVIKKVTNWLGNIVNKVTGWVTQKVVKPVKKWMTETYKEVKTWVEEKVTYVKEKIQQGFEWVKKTIWEPVKQWVQSGTKWVSEKIITPIKKTVQAGWNWVTKTVPNYVTKTVQEGWKTVVKNKNKIIKGGISVAVAGGLVVGLNTMSEHETCGVDSSTGDIIRFDCNVTDFDELSILARKKWVIQFMEEAGFEDEDQWFNNIVGIIEGFEESGEATQGSWLSLVDAEILTAVQDGYALFRGDEIDGRVLTGEDLKLAKYWATFFNYVRNGNELKAYEAWGIAEQAATNYGMEIAEESGVAPDYAQTVFLGTGNIYRWLVEHQSGVFENRNQAVLIKDKYCPDPQGNLDEIVCRISQSTIFGFDVTLDFIDPRSEWAGHHPVYWYMKGLREASPTLEVIWPLLDDRINLYLDIVDLLED